MKILSNKTKLKVIDIFVLFKICFEKKLIILIQHKRLYITRIQPGVNQTWLIHIGHQNSGVFPKKKRQSIPSKTRNKIYFTRYPLTTPVLHPSYHMTPKGKKLKTNANRDFKNDNNQVPGRKQRTNQQKSTTLDLMLGQIAKCYPVTSRIVKNPTSLEQIW